MDRPELKNEPDIRSHRDTLGCTPKSRPAQMPCAEAPSSRELDEQLLDERQLRLHLLDLEAMGEGLEVTLKGSPGTSAERVGLMDLISPLVEQRAFGGQVAYGRAGHQWLDTLIATQRGVRLVRLQLSA